MSPRSANAEAPAAWDHGLSPVVLKRLRLLIRPFSTPSTLAFDHDRYALLDKASPGVWGSVLNRYALFQRLRRREDETEADHRKRQDLWLTERRSWELWLRDPFAVSARSRPREHRHRTQEHRGFVLGKHDVRTMWPDESTNLGTWIASQEELAGSTLELLLGISPTARAFVIDIAADKDRLMARISELINEEREAAGIPPITRRGPQTEAEKKLAVAKRLWPKIMDAARLEAGLSPEPAYPKLNWRPDPPSSEFREFLRAIRDHRIVPLWDLQLAGLETTKHATALALYPELADPNAPKRSARAAKGYPTVSTRSIPRTLLQKIERARELQDESVALTPRLSAVVG
jgi:hypothetical protein